MMIVLFDSSEQLSEFSSCFSCGGTESTRMEVLEFFLSRMLEKFQCHNISKSCVIAM